VSSLVNCSFCPFLPPEELDDKDWFERDTVTIINGQATCLFHAKFLPPGEWGKTFDAVRGEPMRTGTGMPTPIPRDDRSAERRARTSGSLPGSGMRR
jgi:hypothetical protein